MKPWRFAKNVVQVPQIRSLSQLRHRQRSAQHPILVLWSDEPCGVLEPAQEESKARGKRSHRSECSGESHARALTHTSFRNWCSYCVRARAANDPHHRQPCKEPEFPIIMADYCFVQDAPGKELFTILDMLDIALGMMAAISVEEKGSATYVVSAVVEHLRAWGRKKVIFRIDGEPAIRALGVAMHTPEAKKLSSSVDPSIPHHQWVRLRTRTRNSVLLHEKA